MHLRAARAASSSRACLARAGAASATARSVPQRLRLCSRPAAQGGGVAAREGLDRAGGGGGRGRTIASRLVLAYEQQFHEPPPYIARYFGQHVLRAAARVVALNGVSLSMRGSRRPTGSR